MKRFLMTAVIVVSLAGALQTGCTIRHTDPPRTATEQMLLSYAAIQSIARLNVTALNGKTVFIDESHFDSIDKAFVLGEIRNRVLMAGASLAETQEKADAVVEVRSAGVGIDRREMLVGIPSISAAIPGMGQAVVLPEVPFFKVLQQKGRAAVSLLAYDGATSRALFSAGPVLGESRCTDWVVLLIGFTTTKNMPF
jgi:hypothetical protein